MAIPKKEIEKIEKYYADTERLFHLGEVDAAAVVAGKVIEGILLITYKNEGIIGQIDIHGSLIWDSEIINKLFRRLTFNSYRIDEVLQLSSQAAHFEVEYGGRSSKYNKKFDVDSLNDLERFKRDFEKYAAFSNKDRKSVV